MKLIREFSDTIEVLTEEVKGVKTLYIHGILLQSDMRNKNGRVYPYSVLEKESNRYTKELIEQSRALGELGHPEKPDINLDRVSHMFVEMRPEGKNFYGKAKVLNTPNGNIVRGLLEGGAKLGTSSRGTGSVRLIENVSYVQPDFTLATAGDIVFDPSAPDAFVQGIMENVEWICEGGIWKRSTIDSARKHISKASKRDLMEAKLRVWNKFLRSL